MNRKHIIIGLTVIQIALVLTMLFVMYRIVSFAFENPTKTYTQIWLEKVNDNVSLLILFIVYSSTGYSKQKIIKD